MFLTNFQLRGIDWVIVDDEVWRLLYLYGIDDAWNRKPNKLSRGMRRKLCIILAMIGEPKILILDEPAASLDPYSKSEIWNFLTSLKENHTIIVTTHDMQEAEILADRIVIVRDGQVICHGSTLFLKKFYNIGYCINVLYLKDSKLDGIFNIIKKYCNGAELKHRFLNSASFLLTPMETGRLVNMIEELTQRKEDLNLENVSLSIMNLDEVFMRSAIHDEKLEEFRKEEEMDGQSFTYKVRGKLSKTVVIKLVVSAIYHKIYRRRQAIDCLLLGKTKEKTYIRLFGARYC